MVTSPRTRMKEMAAEAEDALAGKFTHYHRSIDRHPREFKPGSRVYYVEDGAIRGFCVVETLVQAVGGKPTNEFYAPRSGLLIYMRCDSWMWVDPVAYCGFQAWRYAPARSTFHVVGRWTDPRPAFDPRQKVVENRD